MRYALALLTHGDAAPLARTLSSFREMVSPDPDALVVCYDGATLYGNGSPKLPPLVGAVATIVTTGKPSGFCAATRKLWSVAAAVEDVDYVFWLEHDFEFLRPVDLRALATPLTIDPYLAQMALMRNAVNEKERAAGGLFESRRDDYVPARLEDGWEDIVPGGDLRWLLHRSYFTTNPSLMRRSFMASRPWPEYEQQCEGLFGVDLVASGYAFAAWGEGEPWVSHHGVRTGFGY